MKQLSREGFDVIGRYPGSTKIGVDVAGENIFGLNRTQGFGVAGIGRTRHFGGSELRPHVAGKIRIGGLPVFRFRVVKDQIAQLGNHLLFGLAIQLGNERHINLAALIQRYKQSFIGTTDVRDRRSPANYVPEHDGGFGRLARAFVVILQGHDQHGVRVFPEFHEVGHSADSAAVGGFSEGRLIDRAVGKVKQVISAVQFPARLIAVRLRPALVL